MKGIVLAAGFGKRMLPITLRRAKPSLPIDGIPIIRRIAEKLEPVVDEIIVNLHHRPQDVVEALKGKSVGFSLEPKLLGTAGGVKRIARLFSLNEDVFIHNGDTILPLDYKNIVDFHTREQNPITMVVSRRKQGYSGISVRKGKVIPDEKGTHVYCGAMVISSELLHQITDGENIIKDFAVKFKVNAFEVEEFLEFTNPKSYLKYHKGNSVEEGAFVHEESIIERSIIMKDAQISKGAVVVDSIVVSGKVPEGEFLKRRIFIDGEVYEIP